MNETLGAGNAAENVRVQSVSNSAAFCKANKIKAGELGIDDILSNSRNRED
ncbi:hypothetical protein CASFOL_037391 [Castilleja foliolosa]|uniref:Uncharacterized protein n=1 Tax=Castilleja foliolosa TaxID=1961234 RepID=A0ABD3BNL2_9LAMI